jgi:hypothetical protein
MAPIDKEASVQAWCCHRPGCSSYCCLPVGVNVRLVRATADDGAPGGVEEEGNGVPVTSWVETAGRRVKQKPHSCASHSLILLHLQAASINAHIRVIPGL